MSGGSFDYAYSRVLHFAEELRAKIANNGKENDYGEKCEFSAQTIARLQSIVEDAERTAKLMKAAEWLYSGDTGENGFAASVLNVHGDARDADETRRLERSKNFYHQRCEALHEWQKSMRDPEREIVCQILANGFVIDRRLSDDKREAVEVAENSNYMQAIIDIPSGFSAGSLFTTSRSTGKNFAIGAKAKLCEWYSADQVLAAFVAGKKEAEQ